MLLECCVDSLASARAGALGGADRIELCADLDVGGTTPDHGTLQRALVDLSIPVFPMIRPRGGDFVLGADDVALLRRDLLQARHLGAPGAVLGALTAEGDVDRDAVARLRELAGTEMQLTFHRAFDVTRDPFTALETLIQLGIDRVLTSGQQDTAWEGRALIADLVRVADGRIVIMAGGGVQARHVVELVRQTDVTEIHLRATDPDRWRRVRKAIERG